MPKKVDQVHLTNTSDFCKFDTNFTTGNYTGQTVNVHHNFCEYYIIFYELHYRPNVDPSRYLYSLNFNH